MSELGISLPSTNRFSFFVCENHIIDSVGYPYDLTGPDLFDLAGGVKPMWPDEINTTDLTNSYYFDIRIFFS